MDFDLIVASGEVVDGSGAGPRRAEIGIVAGTIRAIAPDLSASGAGERLDASGALVVPGLIDLHSHVFRGQDLGVDAAALGPQAGVTTFIDAGSSGAHLVGAFRLGLAGSAGRCRVLAFLNISTIGLTSILLARELEDIRYCSLEACVAALAANADVLVGVKVRIEAATVGRNGLAPLEIARAAAERAGVRLMVHIGDSPPDLATILGLVRPGYIVTHCFTGWGNRITDRDGRVRPEVRTARDRGVRFDIGHGMGSFDAAVAAAALADGFAPDAISTDIHAYARDAVGDLPTVLSKLVALGMDETAALRAVTAGPAAALGRTDGLGTIAVGAPADIAVLERRRGPVEFRDTAGHPFAGDRQFVVRATIFEGTVVYRATA